MKLFRHSIEVLSWEKAGVLLSAGRYDEAIQAFESWLRLEGFEETDRIRTVVAGIEDPAGRTVSRGVLRQLEAEDRVRPIVWVQLWAELDEMEHAIELLETAYADRDPNVIFVGTDPRYATVRSDPRVVRILEEMGLPLGVPEA
jgi:hypothetical protein